MNVFFYKGVLDITTTEVADYVVGGVMACDSSRFVATLEKKVPFVLSVGALDMVNFGAKGTVPGEFQQRKTYEHNEQVCSVFVIFYSITFMLNQVTKMSKPYMWISVKFFPPF